MPRNSNNNLMNAWQWETTLWACLIQVSNVYAIPLFAFFCWHNYHIS